MRVGVSRLTFVRSTSYLPDAAIRRTRRPSSVSNNSSHTRDRDATRDGHSAASMDHRVERYASGTSRTTTAATTSTADSVHWQADRYSNRGRQTLRRWLATTLLVALSLASWTTDLRARRNRPQAPALSPAGTVVIVTLDGVRWQDVFLGLDKRHLPAQSERTDVDIPNLRALMTEQGAALGAPGSMPFSVSGPSFVSLPGYTQLFTGRADVPCTTNACERTVTPTLVDAVGQRFGREQAVVLSSWPDIERAAVAQSDNAIVSAGRHGGAGRHVLQELGLADTTALGEQSEAAPGTGDYRPDELTRALALRVLERQRPRLLYVGLGDTDEHAHHNDYEGYLQALEQFDVWLGEAMAMSERLATRGHPVTFFITTDHGRNDDFANHGGKSEAGRTWLIAGGYGIRGTAPSEELRYLSDLGPTAAYLLGVSLPTATGRVLDELF